MKHIVKQGEPEAFLDWKALANEDWMPTYDDLAGETKKTVKGALMEEQGYICCYCERRLTDGDSHIEHFQPQSDPAVDPLDFSNMLKENLHVIVYTVNFYGLERSSLKKKRIVIIVSILGKNYQMIHSLIIY